MLRGCSHYSFTRKDLEEREHQAADALIEELASQIESKIEDLSALILSDLRREADALSPYEVLMNAPFHETSGTSDLLDCNLKYDADTLEHFSSHFGYEGPECSFSSLF